MIDRLDRYFRKYLDNYVFLELMPHYIKRERLDFMRGVPMPVKKECLKELAGEEGIRIQYFIEGMVDLIGLDSSFRYAPQYINFLNYVNKEIPKIIVSLAIDFAKEEQLIHAAILLRAALRIDRDDPDALYNYMLVCRNLYNDSDDDDYIADLKMEVFESLKHLKEIRPEFAMTYYFLGFAYINAGRYSSAAREWKTFVSLSGPCEERGEIQGRLAELEIPVKIEQAYMDVVNGRWEQGTAVLESYRDEDMLKGWWPLHYYLGVGYNRTGRYQEAIQELKDALKDNPSGAEILAELVIANNALGDEINAEKYRKKLDLIRSRQQKR